MSSPSTRLFGIAAVSVLGLAILSGCATGRAGDTTPTPSTETTGTTTPDPTPTDVESPTPVPTPDESDVVENETPSTTVMFITLDVVDGTLEASGTMPDIVEEGGTCTLTLVRGASAESVDAPTAVGPESTFCDLMTIPTADLSSGDWQATLTYSSSSHHGASGAETVSVP